MDLWEKIPGVENPSLDMLKVSDSAWYRPQKSVSLTGNGLSCSKGFVLVDDVQARTNDEMITYFPKSELSLDPATRELFVIDCSSSPQT